jgi:hypothetical protein
LVRSIFLNLRLWQIANRFVRHNLSPRRLWICPKGICGQPISHVVPCGGCLILVSCVLAVIYHGG